MWKVFLPVVTAFFAGIVPAHGSDIGDGNLEAGSPLRLFEGGT